MDNEIVNETVAEEVTEATAEAQAPEVAEKPKRARKTAKPAVKKAEPVEEATPAVTIETDGAAAETVAAPEDSAATDDVKKPDAPKKRVRRTSILKKNAKGEEKVISLDGEEINNSDVEAFNNAVIELTKSEKTKYILKGTVSAIEQNQYGITAVTYFGPFKVMIRAEDMMEAKITPIGDMDQKNSEAYVLQSYLGANISYIVKGIDANNRVAVGDRVAASKPIQKIYFINTKNGGEPIVTPGRIVEAKVLSVRKYGIRLDIFGFDKFVPIKDLTYSLIDDARTLYKAGDIIQVRLTEIEYETDSNDRPIEVKGITVTGKVKDTKPLQEAITKIDGDKSWFMGEVGMMDERAIFVKIDVSGYPVTVYCPYEKRSIRSGSKVVIKVVKVDLEQLRVWGKIIRVTEL